MTYNQTKLHVNVPNLHMLHLYMYCSLINYTNLIHTYIVETVQITYLTTFVLLNLIVLQMPTFL